MTTSDSEPLPPKSDVALGPKPGGSWPLGAAPSSGGVNFSVFSKHATGVELLLFDGVDDGAPTRTIKIDPATNRTYHYWHVFVPGVAAAQLYGYRVHGPYDPANGMRFDAASEPGDNIATAMKSVVVDSASYE